MLIRAYLAARRAEDRKRLRALLRAESDVSLQSMRSKSPVWERLIAQRVDLLVVDLRLVPEPVENSLATLADLPDAPGVVVLSSNEESELHARLLAAGCLAVLDTSLEDTLLKDALTTLIERLRGEANAALTPPQLDEQPRLSDFVSESPAMVAFLQVVRRVVAADATLLLIGETGVGKERLAQAMHAESPRSAGPFVAVNCGAIPEALLESELFGHEEGAFTGATRTRRGWFELAHRGTVFLDEIGEMPLHLQVKLLRVLQTREVVPVGSEKSIKVDVRVMAATNQDLERGVKEKNFRADLFYRLSVVTLEIPALRDRKDDIRTLAQRYVEYFQSRFATGVQGLSDEAMCDLEEYDWPGNVRELVNVIERAMLLCPGTRITPEYLPDGIRSRKTAIGNQELVAASVVVPLPKNWKKRPYREVRKEVMRSLERVYFSALLEETAGCIGKTAERAGMNPRNLFEKLKNCGLRKEEFRTSTR